MNAHQFFKLFAISTWALLLSTTLISCTGNELHVAHDIDNRELVAKAQTLPAEGILKIEYTDESRTFIYLKVDERFITDLEPLLRGSGITPDRNQIGAHITVFTDKEAAHLTGEISELGDTFDFRVYGVDRVKVKKVINPYTQKSEVQEDFIITVDSPKLKALRKKYGFSAFPYGSEPFHITIGRRFLPEAASK